AGAVEWIAGLNPITLVEERKAENPNITAERALFAALHAKFGGNRWTAAEAVAAEDISPDLWEDAVRHEGLTKPTGVVFGNWLRARRDRMFGDLALRTKRDDKTSTNVNYWRLQKIGA